MKKLLLLSTLVLSLNTLHAVEKFEVPTIDYTLKEGKGKNLVEANCLMCHSFGYIENQRLQSRAFWHAKVLKMIKAFKAPIDPKDVPAITEYLFEHYGDGK